MMLAREMLYKPTEADADYRLKQKIDQTFLGNGAFWGIQRRQGIAQIIAYKFDLSVRLVFHDRHRRLGHEQSVWEGLSTNQFFKYLEFLPANTVPIREHEVGL